MQPTPIRTMPIMADGRSGIRPWRQPQKVTAYKSPFGPAYKTRFNLAGIDAATAMRWGGLAGGFGVTAGIFALFFFDGVPRVQKDILQKVPFVGSFFKHEIPPEDNPF